MNLQSIETRFIRMQFGAKSRLKVYEKLAEMMRNGLSLTRSMTEIEKHMSRDGAKPKEPTAFALRDWVRRTKGGDSFAETIRDWVPRDDVNIIAAGERSGNLIETLDNVRYLTLAQKRMRSSVVKAILYPLVLMIVAIGFTIFFSRNVIPSFNEVWPKENWYGLAASMRWIAEFVETGLLPVVGVLVAVMAAVAFSLPRWTGTVRSKFDSIPPFSIYRLVVGGGFLLTMAIMMRSGLQIRVGINGLMRYASPWLRERLQLIYHASSGGSDLAKALSVLPYEFPDREIVNDLRAYSTLEGFDRQLLKIGKDSIEKTIVKIDAQANVMKFAGMLFMFGIIIWFVLGMFSIQSQVMQGVSSTAG